MLIVVANYGLGLLQSCLFRHLLTQHMKDQRRVERYRELQRPYVAYSMFRAYKREKRQKNLKNFVLKRSCYDQTHGQAHTF